MLSEGFFLGKVAKFWAIGGVAAVSVAVFIFARPAPEKAQPENAPPEIEISNAADTAPPANGDATPEEPTSIAVPETEVTAQIDTGENDSGMLAASMGASTGEGESSETGEATPEVSNGLDAALQSPTTENGSGQRPQPDTNVAKASTPLSNAAPDPVIFAPALGDSPAIGATPDLTNELSGAPAQEAVSLLGESSPPLSLAQVLPPGEAPLPDQIAPSFDLVRVAPDGSAVIAGRAAPGANVQVFSGTIPVAEATASARGEFVIFLNAPSETTLDLQIPAAPEGATLVVSQEDIIILPAAPDAADATPIVVRRTPDAVQIVQPSGPAIPSNVSLDLVSYAESGAVQLAGRGQPGNVARIYTDGQLAGEAPIAQGGNWALEISDIAEGRYVLRVDEISVSGEVLSRTESPFQRQFPEANLPDSFSQGAKIIVQPGNTLWLMATEAYGDGDAYSQIFSANQDAIRDPDLIYPGQIFSIPRIEE